MEKKGLALASDLAVRKIRLATDNISVVNNISRVGARESMHTLSRRSGPEQEVSCVQNLFMKIERLM